jgi:putative ABC transport system substrate-binding protein
MRRRDFTIVLGGAAVWPLVAHAQQHERMRRIGVLMGSEEHDLESQTRISALQQGLEALGWSEGSNIRIDYRFGGGDPERIDRYVAQLVSVEPDLIVANSSPVLAALKRATGTVPIVFAAVVDPVGQGFVASLAHPGGNITGFTLVEFEIIGKWLELLKEMAPRTRRTTLLFNPMMAAPFNALLVRWLQVAPNTLATEFAAAPVQDEAAIEAAIAAVARGPGGGLIAGLAGC